MVVMKNIQGYHFEIYPDSDWEFVYSGERKDVTDEVYKELLVYWPEFKEDE
jgi:hypothetical protein